MGCHYNFSRYLKSRCVHILQPAHGRTLSCPRCHSISPVRLHLTKLIARHREIQPLSAAKQQALTLLSLKSPPQRNWHHLAWCALLPLCQQTCNRDMFCCSQKVISNWCLVFLQDWIHDVSPRSVIMLTHSRRSALTNGQLVASRLHATACLSHGLSRLKMAKQSRRYYKLALLFFPYFCSVYFISFMAINSAADQHL